MNKINFNKNLSLSWDKVLSVLIETLLLAGIFLVPLSISLFGSAYSSFDLQKIFILRLFGASAFLLIVLREIFFPSIGFKKFVAFFKKYWLFPTIFILILGVLVFFSSNQALSFYGSYARQHGYLSYLLYFLWFALLSFNLFVIKEKTGLKKAIRNIAITIILSTVLISVYAIFQYFGLDFFEWASPAYLTRRTFSTLGQPNFLASFLLLVIPLPLYFFTKQKNIWLKFACALSFFLMIFAIFSTASRGGLLALFFAFFVFVVYKLFFGGLSRNKKIVITASFIFFIALSSFLIERALPGRITGMFNLNYGSSAARVAIYSSSLSLIKEKPFFGYGQENLQDYFFAYYEADWGVHDNVSQVADRAHNIILDILLNGGVFSLLAHFLLYGFFFILAWRIIRSKKEESGFALAILIGTSSYLFSLLFSFSVPSTEFYFFVIFALLIGLKLNSDRIELEEQILVKGFSKVKKIILVLLLVLISVFSIYRTINYFLADYYFNSAISYFFQYKFPEAVIVLEYSDKAKTNLLHKIYYQYTSADIIANNYPYRGEQATNQMLKERLELSLKFPAQTVSDLKKRALIEEALGDHEAAFSSLNKIKELAPNWPDLNLAEANLYLKESKYDLALSVIKSAWGNLPDVNHEAINEEHRKIVRSYRANIFYYEAKVYEAKGDLDLASEAYENAYQENPANYMILKDAADMEFMAGNFDKALDFVLQGYKLSPNDFNWPLMASYIYDAKKNKEEAGIWLDKAKALGYVFIE